ncbi:ABC transporter, ATP-binding protein [Enterococcus faecalis 13-SD-W-01]|nr:ABC transporter, ATP-binding protein [Enterococcus faecalis 13-SD-W-01]
MSVLIQGMTIKRGKKKIIDNLNLSIMDGEVVALVAPNGTGKTTLLNGIAQLLPSIYRKLEINSFSPHSLNFKRSFFYLESSNNLFEHLNILEHLLVIKKNWQSEIAVDEVINLLKIQQYPTLPIKKMSLGMKQHALLATYLISDAPVLLFDEPLNGLDPGSIEITNAIIQNLAYKNKIILFSSHDIANIQAICNRVIFLKNGKIERDTKNMDQILELYKQLYGG